MLFFTTVSLEKKQADCIAACFFILMLTDFVAFSIG